jgi:3-oxoacyl-[acyl-carrier protein] reductase
MDNPIALVTGGARGIGRAIARRLSRDGFFVIVNYRRQHEAAAEVETAIRADGGACALHAFDVADREQVEAAVKAITAEWGRVSVLVNNAGYIRDQPLVRMSDEDWDGVLATNLNGAYHCTKAVLKTWTGRAPGRRVINITSAVGLIGRAYQTNYCASKAGLIGFTKALARELAGKEITVNAVAPGLIETEATAHLDEAMVGKILQEVPLGRLGRPDEIAAMVSFLASAEARYITGQVVAVDGGFTM